MATRVGDWDADKLERASRYMRELDQSSNARAAIELARREQDVTLAGEHARAKEAEAARAAAAVEQERVRWEEQRRTIETRAAHERATVDYKAQRQRQLLAEEDGLVRRRDEDNRRRALEDERAKAAIRVAAEVEAAEARRRADEHRARLEREALVARATAEADGRIKEGRANEDVHARADARRAAAARETRLAEISLTLERLGAGLDALLRSPGQLAVLAGAVTAVAGGVYGAREAARLAGRALESRLGRPSLVRETSRLSLVAGRGARAAALQQLRGGSGGWVDGLRRRLPWGAGAAAGGGAAGNVDDDDVSGLLRDDAGAARLSDVVLGPDAAARVERAAAGIAAARAHGAHFRNLLLYGPPGTGKTMAAKRLARSSGLDYAVMTGGDVGPLGRDAVTELHRLFDWAATSSSRKGLLLFIDEADAFLGSRSRGSGSGGGAMSEDTRNALNAFLYRTGTPSSRVVLVLATNRPGDLDPAVVDRCDEALLFPLPDADARGALLTRYFRAYVRNASGAGSGLFVSLLGARSHRGAIAVAPELTDDYLRASLVARTDGFSGREIAKLMLAVQADAYARSSAALPKAGGGTGSGGGGGGWLSPAPPAASLDRAGLEETVAWKLREHAARRALAGHSSGDNVGHAQQLVAVSELR